MNRTLLSLAIIRTNWEHLHKDYIENYVPLVGSLIKQKDYTEIANEKIGEICNDFKSEFGLVIPSYPMVTILNRLSKQKYIKKDRGKFIPNFEKLKKIDISKKSTHLIREFEKVINSLINFINDKHNIKFEINVLENGLINYLKKHDLDLLFAAEGISILPNVKYSKKIEYLISEFISVAFKSEPEIFKYIFNLTVGHALSSTILYKEFNSYSGKLKGLNIYFDTPFIMNLLGISGDLKQKLAEELVSIIQKEKAHLFILDTTKDEVDSNLDGALKLLEKGETSPLKGTLTFKNCLTYNLTINDIEEIYIHLPDILEKYGIKLDDVPNYDNFRNYQVDEEELYNTIVNTYDSIRHIYSAKDNCNIAFLKQIKENTNKKTKSAFDDESKINYTIYRDVKVLSGIYRFRKSNKPRTLKDCKYIFVTTNSALAYASRKFESIEYKNVNTLPTCLTDVFLGTLIWLHSPAELQNISEKKLIADCYASMTPSVKLITKYIDEVERLKKNNSITKDSYYLLRTHKTAFNILKSKTLGDPNEFNAQTVKEILDELINEIKREEKEKLEKEIIDHKLTKEDLEKEKEKHKITKKELESVQGIEGKSTETIKTNIEYKAKKSADRIVKLIITLFEVLLILSFIIQAINFFFFSIPFWLFYSGWIILGISGLFNILVKFNIKDFKSTLFMKLFKYFKNKEESRYYSFLISNHT